MSPLGEKMPNAAQIAEAFFTDITHKQQIMPRANARRIQSAQIAEIDGERPGIVADARGKKLGAFALHAHIRPCGKYSIQMRSNHQNLAIAEASAEPHHIADLILLHFFQPMVAQHGKIGGGAFFFREGRRWDLRERDAIFDHARMIGGKFFGSSRKARIGANGRDGFDWGHCLFLKPGASA